MFSLSDNPINNVLNTATTTRDINPKVDKPVNIRKNLEPMLISVFLDPYNNLTPPSDKSKKKRIVICSNGVYFKKPDKKVIMPRAIIKYTVILSFPKWFVIMNSLL